jgi:hypothetical protein
MRKRTTVAHNSGMRLAYALLALLTSVSAFAAPVIHNIRPPYVFRFGPTHVTITGTGFAEPVQVFVGDVPALVREVTPTSIAITIVPSIDGAPRAYDEEAELRIVMPGVGEATMARAVRFVNSTTGAENYVLYLVPFTTEIIPGANGSRWTGELTFFNAGAFDSEIGGSFSNPERLSPPGAALHRPSPATDHEAGSLHQWRSGGSVRAGAEAARRGDDDLAARP